MKPLLKVGDRVFISARFIIEITKITNFSGCENYGFMCQIEKLGEATRYSHGWMLCEILDYQISRKEASLIAG